MQAEVIPSVSYFLLVCLCTSCWVAGAKTKGYGTRQEEAVQLFGSLIQAESISDYVPVIQGILQTAFDLPDMKSEVRSLLHLHILVDVVLCCCKRS